VVEGSLVTWAVSGWLLVIMLVSGLALLVGVALFVNSQKPERTPAKPMPRPNPR
jgi:hypothetical protein